MKSLRFSLLLLPALAVFAMFATAAPAVTTNTTAGATSSKGSGTNAAPGESSVPVSVFDLTANPTKDPFFPLSTRQAITVTNSAAPSFSISEFNLKGLSGSAHSRLALINNRTFAEGEDNELATASGKIKVHCVEIKDQSVVIRVSGQHDTMEIFLRKAAR